MIKKEISVVVPVYNEQKAVRETIAGIKSVISSLKHNIEIIAVDDGSYDRSNEILSKIPGIRLIRHPYNIGYGAAIKTGIKKAKGDWILIIDGDGTYPENRIPDLIRGTDRYDMIIGARTGKKVEIPFIRKPAKFIIGALASFVTSRHIPDLNSGLRIFKKDITLKYMQMFPDRFSFTTTITLICLTKGYFVRYVPINYYRRRGISKMRAQDFINFITLIVRIIMYFKPLKFFIIPCILLFLSGFVYAVFQIVLSQNIGQLPIILILSGLQIGFLGLLADVIVKQNMG